MCIFFPIKVSISEEKPYTKIYSRPMNRKCYCKHDRLCKKYKQICVNVASLPLTNFSVCCTTLGAIKMKHRQHNTIMT